MKKKNISIDIETLDTRASSVILSIGAVEFDNDGLGKTFYTPISIDSCLAHGLTISQSTLLWWMDQSAQARESAFVGSDIALPAALQALTEAFDWTNMRVWANGADFDLPIISNAYRAAESEAPWQYYNSRCYRTLKNTVPKDVYSRLKVEPRLAHDALEDAVAQALTAINIQNYLEKCYAGQAERDSQVPKQAYA